MPENNQVLSPLEKLKREFQHYKYHLPECPICGWTVNGEEYSICPCCGYEPGYDDSMVGGIDGYRDRWDGTWWARDIEGDEPPQIVQRLQARVKELENTIKDLRTELVCLTILV